MEDERWVLLHLSWFSGVMWHCLHQTLVLSSFEGDLGQLAQWEAAACHLKRSPDDVGGNGTDG